MPSPWGIGMKPAAHARAFDPAGAWVRRHNLVMPFWSLPGKKGAENTVDGGVGDVRPTVGRAPTHTKWPKFAHRDLGWTPQTAPSGGGSSSYILTDCDPIVTPAVTNNLTIAGILATRFNTNAVTARKVISVGVASAPVLKGPGLNYKESTDTMTFHDFGTAHDVVIPQGEAFSFVLACELGGTNRVWVNGELHTPFAASAPGFWDYIEWGIGVGVLAANQGTVCYLLIISPNTWGVGEANAFSRDPWAAIRPRR